MSKNWNVRYFDENGNKRFYLGVNVTKDEAIKWTEEFNNRYRKAFPNGKGYYAAAKPVILIGNPND